MKTSKYLFLSASLATAMMVILSACSSSSKTENESGIDELPAADVLTDPVPENADASAEAPSSTTELASSTPELPESPAVDAAPIPPPAPADELQANATPTETPSPTPSSPEPAATTSSTQAELANVAQPNPAPAANVSTQDYRVRAGDTLMRIAFEFYGDLHLWKKIFEFNQDKIKNPNAIPVGLKIKIENDPALMANNAKRGEKFMIRTGDTLGTISHEVYGTPMKWRKIWKNNKELIQNPNRIFAGFYIYYTMTPTERAEAERLKNQSAPAPLAQPSGMDPAQNNAPAAALPQSSAPQGG